MSDTNQVMRIVRKARGAKNLQQVAIELVGSVRDASEARVVFKQLVKYAETLQRNGRPAATLATGSISEAIFEIARSKPDPLKITRELQEVWRPAAEAAFGERMALRNSRREGYH